MVKGNQLPTPTEANLQSKTRQFRRAATTKTNFCFVYTKNKSAGDDVAASACGMQQPFWGRRIDTRVNSHSKIKQLKYPPRPSRMVRYRKKTKTAKKKTPISTPSCHASYHTNSKNSNKLSITPGPYPHPLPPCELSCEL